MLHSLTCTIYIRVVVVKDCFLSNKSQHFVIANGNLH